MVGSTIRAERRCPWPSTGTRNVLRFGWIPIAHAGGILPSHLEPTLYRDIIECVADPVYVIDPANGYHLVYVNEAACRHYGLTRESLVEMAIPDWDPNFPDVKELDEKFRRLKQAGSVRIESVHQLADGRRIPVEISVNYFRHKDQEYMVGCFHDISDRKKAEVSLRDSEQRFRDIATSTGELIWELDAEGRFVYVTEPAVARFGHSASELLGKRPFDFLFPEDLPWILDYFSRVVKQNPSFRGLEHRIQTATGETTWVQVSGTRIVDQEGRIKGFRGTTSNITERKLAEERLERERQHLREILDSLLIFVAVMKPDGTVIEVNRASLEAAGIQREDLLGTQFAEAKVWSDRPESQRRLRSAIRRAGQGMFVRYDLPVHLGMGSVIIDFFIGPIRDNRGQIVELVACGVDITERKRAEETIREERDKAQRYLDTVDTMIVGLDPRGHVTLVNRKGCELLGYAETELLGKNWFTTCLPQSKDIDTIVDTFESIIAGKLEGVAYFENTIVTRCGDERLIAWHNNVLRDAQGNILGTLSAGEDITARRRAERLEAGRTRFLEQLAKGATLAEVLAVLTESIETLSPGTRCAIDLLDGKEPRHLPSPTGSGPTHHRYGDGNTDGSGGQSVDESGAEAAPSGVWPHPIYNSAGETIGTFLCHHRDAREPNVIELKEIRTAAHLAGIAIERKRAEEALRQAQDRQRQLIAYQQSILEDERRRIARELHDELAQELSVLKLRLSLLKSDLPAKKPHLTEAIDDMEVILRRTLTSVGRIAADLRPPALDELGLMTALDTLVKEFSQRTGISGHFNAAPADLDIDHRLAMALYRIVQESLTNVMRHARASQLSVKLQGEPSGTIILTVQDNGVGLTESDTRKQKSFGLIGIRERVEILGGTMEIQSRPGLGTTIKISLPGFG